MSATIQTIDCTNLARLIEQNKDLCLLDVRTPAEFETVHAAQARSFPLSDLNPKQFMAGRPADQPVYLICKGGTRSRKAAELFVSEGFGNVVSVNGGTDAWVSAGLAVEKSGRNTLPLDRQMQCVAGAMCLSGAILGYAVSPWFYLLCAMVGAGLMTAGLTGFCAMVTLLSRMPWNKASGHAGATCCSPRK